MSRTIKLIIAAIASVFLVSLTACSSSTQATPNMTDAWVGSIIVPGMTGMFGTVNNPGKDPIVLIGGSSPIAESVTIHEVVKDGTVEKMQPLVGGLTIPAGGSVQLKSGSYHIMLEGLKSDIKVGENIEVTLNFQGGQTIKVSAPVKQRDGM